MHLINEKICVLEMESKQLLFISAYDAIAH
jgi:hypothetical protein